MFEYATSNASIRVSVHTRALPTRPWLLVLMREYLSVFPTWFGQAHARLSEICLLPNAHINAYGDSSLLTSAALSRPWTRSSSLDRVDQQLIHFLTR